MSVERVFYCDWKECEESIQTDAVVPNASFLTVAQDDAEPEHFCSWDCLLKRAAEIPPVEAIEA